jgi:hypothetical protein
VLDGKRRRAASPQEEWDFLLENEDEEEFVS